MKTTSEGQYAFQGDKSQIRATDSLLPTEGFLTFESRHRRDESKPSVETSLPKPIKILSWSKILGKQGAATELNRPHFTSNVFRSIVVIFTNSATLLKSASLLKGRPPAWTKFLKRR